MKPTDHHAIGKFAWYMFRDILLNVDFLKTASADVVANVCYRLL